jgi:hypothetical protein
MASAGSDAGQCSMSAMGQRTSRLDRLMSVLPLNTGHCCVRLRSSKSAKSGGRRLIRSPHGTPGVTESTAIRAGHRGMSENLHRNGHSGRNHTSTPSTACYVPAIFCARRIASRIGLGSQMFSIEMESAAIADRRISPCFGRVIWRMLDRPYFGSESGSTLPGLSAPAPS